MEKMAHKPTMGKLIKEENSYLLEVNGERHALPDGLVAQNPELAKLEGNEVEVMLSVPKPVVVAVRIPGRPPILCYIVLDFLLKGNHWIPTPAAASESVRSLVHDIKPACYVPADWMIRGVEEQVRRNFADQMLKDGIISKDVYGQLFN